MHVYYVLISPISGEGMTKVCVCVCVRARTRNVPVWACSDLLTFLKEKTRDVRVHAVIYLFFLC